MGFGIHRWAWGSASMDGMGFGIHGWAWGLASMDGHGFCFGCSYGTQLCADFMVDDMCSSRSLTTVAMEKVCSLQVLQVQINQQYPLIFVLWWVSSAIHYSRSFLIVILLLCYLHASYPMKEQ